MIHKALKVAHRYHVVYELPNMPGVYQSVADCPTMEAARKEAAKYTVVPCEPRRRAATFEDAQGQLF